MYLGISAFSRFSYKYVHALKKLLCSQRNATSSDANHSSCLIADCICNTEWAMLWSQEPTENRGERRWTTIITKLSKLWKSGHTVLALHLWPATGWGLKPHLRVAVGVMNLSFPGLSSEAPVWWCETPALGHLSLLVQTTQSSKHSTWKAAKPPETRSTSSSLWRTQPSIQARVTENGIHRLRAFSWTLLLIAKRRGRIHFYSGAR